MDNMIELYYFLFIVVGLPLIFYVLLSLPLYHLFKRSNTPSWLAFVPFARNYGITKAAFGDEYALLFLLEFVPIVGTVAYAYFNYSFAKAFGKSDIFAIVSIFFPIITWYVLWLDKSDYQKKQPFLNNF